MVAEGFRGTVDWSTQWTAPRPPGRTHRTHSRPVPPIPRRQRVPTTAPSTTSSEERDWQPDPNVTLRRRSSLPKPEGQALAARAEGSSAHRKSERLMVRGPAWGGAETRRKDRIVSGRRGCGQASSVRDEERRRPDHVLAVEVSGDDWSTVTCLRSVGLLAIMWVCDLNVRARRREALCGGGSACARTRGGCLRGGWR